jgi:hypothetical protein
MYCEDGDGCIFWFALELLASVAAVDNALILVLEFINGHFIRFENSLGFQS